MFLYHGTALAVCLALTLAAGCQQEPSAEKKATATSDKQAATPSEKNPTEKKATDSSEPVAKPKDADAGAKSPTAREVLERMTTAYHNASSYSDAGIVHLVAEAGDKKTHDVKANFSLALVRPNKLRIEAYHVSLVSDGKKLYATLGNLPGQVLVRPAPEALNLKALDVDLILAHSLIQDFAGMMPQIMLLFGDKALDELLHEAEEPELAQSVAIDGHDCYRVKIKFPGDMATFWIDRQTYVLRRLVMPTNGMRQNLSQREPVDNLSIIADFTDSQINTKVDPKAFEFEMPREAEEVSFFIPPGIKTAMAVLNKPAPANKFVDIDGKPLAPESLAGKVVVFDFWASWCQPCQESLPELEKTREKYKDNPKVAFYAVSVDRPEVDNKELAKLFEALKVNIPILRDPEDSAAAFHFRPIPATFIIDEKGIVQDFQEGYNPQSAEELPAKLDKLLAGGNIVEGSLKRYQDEIEELRQYAERPEKSPAEPKDAASATTPAEPKDAAAEEKVALPETATAPPSKPTTFKMLPLWKCDELKAPGNILVLGGKNEPARLLVVENWNSLAEVALDGKLIALHKIDLDEKAEFICSLRAFATADGKRYVAAFAAGRQRFYLFDSNWKQILTYPEDALTSPHSGIADVQLADLDGDGVPKIYVGYFGTVGVHAVSLEGKRLWANREITNVTHLAVGPADEKGRGTLLCATVTGLPVIVDAEGQAHGQINIPVQGMSSILSADLRGDGELLWCGMTASETQKNVAIGFSLKGPLLWEYALPNGVQPRPIEPIIVGQIKSDGPRQWILPGADGSIHIVAPDGRLMDRFDYGLILQGLATVQIDGQPTMIVSSAKGLEAWKGR